ncbi:MAG: Plug domain-containing protein [Chitinivibrionales bacterium]|nr:Plug domain-containing protein [Chitinivibrionales bacterium]
MYHSQHFYIASIILILLWHLLYSDSDTVKVHTDSNTVQELDTISVTAQKEKKGLSIQLHEEKIGLTDDLHDALAYHPGIKRVYESGSSFLVRGESPFDVLFLVHSVPVFSPSHFATIGIFDRSSVLITSLNNIDIITDHTAGSAINASGGVVKLNPEIVRFSSPRMLKRPEIVAHLGIKSFDVSTSIPMRKGHDLYQISNRMVNTYQLAALTRGRFKDMFENGFVGFGKPLGYGDLIINGKQDFGETQLQEYILSSFDKDFDLIKSKMFPELRSDTFLFSAIASAHLRSTFYSIPFEVTIGGASQFYSEGKRFGQKAAHIFVTRRNQIAEISIKPILTNDVSIMVKVWNEYLKWRGYHRITSFEPKSKTIDKIDYLSFKGTHELSLCMSAEARHHLPSAELTYSALVASIFPYRKYLIDPGVSFEKYFNDKTTLQVATGIVSSQPDIRGAPSPEYRSEIAKTYSVSLGIKNQITDRLNASVDFYGKWRDHCPQFMKQLPFYKWDESLGTSLAVGGIDIQADASLTPTVSLFTTCSFSRSERIKHSSYHRYEWDVPVLINTTTRFSPNNSTFSYYFIGVFGPGLPYYSLERDGESPQLARTISRVKSLYKRVDFKWQSSNEIHGHRYFTRYDGYVEITNILNLPMLFTKKLDRSLNVQQYFWNENGYPKPVYCDYISFIMGVRVGFRL